MKRNKSVPLTSDRNGLDPVIDTPERIPARFAMKTAASLKPGEAMMNACVYGNEEAIAIRDAWGFSFPVKVVYAEEFAAMVERGKVTFGG